MTDPPHLADEPIREILLHGVAPAVFAGLLLGLSALADFAHPGDHWTQRSGSIVTVLGAYVAYVNAQRSKKFIAGELYFNSELPYRWISLVLVVTGTVTWGYGDLILCKRKINDALFV